MWPDLHERAAYPNLRTKDQARDGACGDPAGGFARGTPAAAARVTYAIFQLVGEIRMPWPVGLRDGAIILGTLIDIVDVQRNRGSCRHALEHA